MLSISVDQLSQIPGIGDKTLKRIIDTCLKQKGFISKYSAAIELEINSIINGDCLELMNGIMDKSVDMILADLPYGTTNCAWDSRISLDKLWAHYTRIIKDSGAIVLMAQTPFDKLLGFSNIEMLRYEWIWEKTQPTGHYNAKKMPMKAHENALVFYKQLPTYNPQITVGHSPMNSYTKSIKAQNKSNVYGEATKEIVGGGKTWRYPRSVQVFKSDKQFNYIHPAQKPVALFEYFIRTYTNAGDLVLDNVIGSGTTAIACGSTKRNFIGMELDKEYFTLATDRISKARENK